MVINSSNKFDSLLSQKLFSDYSNNLLELSLKRHEEFIQLTSMHNSLVRAKNQEKKIIVRNYILERNDTQNSKIETLITIPELTLFIGRHYLFTGE